MVVAFVAFDGAGFAGPGLAGQPVNSKADTMKCCRYRVQNKEGELL